MVGTIPEITTRIAVATDVPTSSADSLFATNQQYAEGGMVASNPLADLATEYSEMQIFDTYKVPDESLVHIQCPNKKIDLWAMVVEAWSFSLESKWDGKALGTLADSNILRGIDTIAQDVGGISLNQPVLNRRVWGGTSPFGATLKLRFIAQTSAMADVYIPMLKLAALLTPRVLAGVKGLEGALSLFAIPGPAPFGGDAVLAALAKQVGTTAPKKNYSGDNVSIAVGKTIDVRSAYITKLQGVFSKSIASDGYPLAGEAVITFESMDTPFFVYDDANGDNQVDQNRNNIFKNANALPSDLGGAIIDWLSHAKEGAAAAFNAATAVANPSLTGAKMGVEKTSKSLSSNTAFTG